MSSSSDSEGEGVRKRRGFRYENDDDDYEEEEEENPTHRRKRQSKNEQIYGVFYDASSGEGEEQGGGRQTRKRARQVVKTGGVKFVKSTTSTEQQRPPAQQPEQKQREEEEEDEDEEEAPEKEMKSILQDIKTNEDFRKFLLQPQVEDQQPEAAEPKSSGSSASSAIGRSAPAAPAPPLAPPSAAAAKIPKDLGKWEKHTKGFGRKMLEKFGFTGALGQRGTGVTTNVEVTVRPAGAGLGFGGVKEAAQLEANKRIAAEMRGEEYKPPEQKPKMSLVEQMAASGGWKKSRKKDKEKGVKYVTAEEILESSASAAGAGAEQKQVIIDMRGSSARVVTDLSTLHAEPDIQAKPQLGQELLYNINLLVDLAEKETTARANRLRAEEDRLTNLEHDFAQLQTRSTGTISKLERLEKLAAIIERIHTKIVSDPLSVTVEAVVNAVINIRDTFDEEYTLFGVGRLVPSLLLPIVQARLTEWDPLQNSAVIAEFALPLKRMLDDRASGISGQETIDSIVKELMLPPIRQAVVNRWSVHDAADVVLMFEHIASAVSGPIFDNLVDTLLMPKLSEAVKLWNPTTDVVPIHTWIHPWLPLLKSKLSTFFPEIRRKFGSALTRWQPSDESAMTVLKPWFGVFDRTSLETFLIRNIVPKLVAALRELHIDPKNQDLRPIGWVLAWKDVLPRFQIVSLFEGEFFPRWLQTLYMWLQHNPDLQEVTAWYIGWKSHFPPELQEDERMLAQFNRALEMMNQYLTDPASLAPPYPAEALERISYFTVVEQAKAEAGARAQRAASATATAPSRGPISAHNVTFKEVVEAFAEEHGVEFVPKPGRQYNGKQIFSFNGVPVYLDQDVAFAMLDKAEGWTPVSLDELLAAPRK